MKIIKFIFELSRLLPPVPDALHNFSKAFEKFLKPNIFKYFLQDPPFSSIQEHNGVLVGQGYAFQILGMLKNRFSFTYKIVPPVEQFLGDDKTGIVSMLAKNVRNLNDEFQSWEQIKKQTDSNSIRANQSYSKLYRNFVSWKMVKNQSE